jgi:hypothetical protein
LEIRAIPKLWLAAVAAALVAALTAGYTAYWEAQLEARAAHQMQEHARQVAHARAAGETLRDELRTVKLANCRLKRYGGPDDGGYLMCENLMKGVQAAYSYGIGREDEWGCQVSRELRVRVHQYDCFTPARPSCEGGRFVFHEECVSARQEAVDSRRFDTIAAQIARNGDSGKRLLVKLDVEGAEWESLLATPDEVLDRIDQMPMELHGTHSPRFVDLIRRLKTRFHLVNLHFNNNACTANDPLPSRVFQVLWVNKRIGVIDPHAPSPAPSSPLNAPDAPPRPDGQLGRGL